MRALTNIGARWKFLLQGMAFALIMLAPVGLYLCLRSGWDQATWPLLGLVGIGMALAMWVS